MKNINLLCLFSFLTCVAGEGYNTEKLITSLNQPTVELLSLAKQYCNAFEKSDLSKQYREESNNCPYITVNDKKTVKSVDFFLQAALYNFNKQVISSELQTKILTEFPQHINKEKLNSDFVTALNKSIAATLAKANQ